MRKRKDFRIKTDSDKIKAQMKTNSSTFDLISIQILCMYMMAGSFQTEECVVAAALCMFGFGSFEDYAF